MLLIGSTDVHVLMGNAKPGSGLRKLSTLVLSNVELGETPQKGSPEGRGYAFIQW